MLPISRIIHRRRPSDESICYLDKLAYRYRLWSNSFIVIIIIFIIIIIIYFFDDYYYHSYIKCNDYWSHFFLSCCLRFWEQLRSMLYGIIIIFFSCTELSRVIRKFILAYLQTGKTQTSLWNSLHFMSVNSFGSNNGVCEKQRLWSDCADAQADQKLCCYAPFKKVIKY